MIVSPVAAKLSQPWQGSAAERAKNQHTLMRGGRDVRHEISELQWIGLFI